MASASAERSVSAGVVIAASDIDAPILSAHGVRKTYRSPAGPV